jgi:hypothetical protein
MQQHRFLPSYERSVDGNTWFRKEIDHKTKKDDVVIDLFLILLPSGGEARRSGNQEREHTVKNKGGFNQPIV